MNGEIEWKQFWKNKLLEKRNLCMIVLIGIFFLIISMPIKEKKNKNFLYKQQGVAMEEGSEHYIDVLERKLSKNLSRIDGVGKNHVMITLKATEGDVLYTKKEIAPPIEGVVIIAEGGEQPIVVKNITDVVQALFDVDTHKIKVMKMN